MKRRIKFRGKCAGMWRKGDHLTYANGEVIKAWLGSISPEYTVEPESVGQFTGAYDIDDNEIYEGDICELVLDGYVVYVDWDAENCQFAFYMKSGKKSNIEFDKWVYEICRVIGNKFDNPELLKGSD